MLEETAPLRWAATLKALCLLVLLAGGRAEAAVLPVVEGPAVDLDPALVLLDQGGVLVVFERLVPRQGNKVDSDLIAVRALSLDDAVRGIWEAPVPVSAASARDVDEGQPELVRLPNGGLGLFYVSDASGAEQIWLSVSVDEGSTWSQPTQPLALGGLATARRHPAVIVERQSILLAYEADIVAETEARLNFSLTPTGLSWDAPIRLALDADSPSLALLRDGDHTVVYRDRGTGALRVIRSPTGVAGTWSAPVRLPVEGGLDPALLGHWDGRPAVWAAAPDPDQDLAIYRTYRTYGLWGQPERPDDWLAGGPSRNPEPVVIEPGVLCMAFDLRSEAVGTPTDADVVFGCRYDFSCLEAPTFAGVRAVIDVEPCFTNGLRLTWDPPTDYGSAQVEGARYYVYRGTTPDFPLVDPIAGPLTGTSWLDVEAEPEQTYWYAVRAENLEDCPVGTGPMGGMLDTNTVRKEGIDAVPLPPDGPVRGLRIDLGNVTDRRMLLTWETHPEAGYYRVYRMDAPVFDPGGFSVVVDPIDTMVELPRGLADLSFLDVRPVSQCGLEGD